MESMPAPPTPVTVGVDTHLETHVAAVVDQTGRLLGTQGFSASTRGYVALVTWAERLGRWPVSGSRAPAPSGLA
jgi:transposase